MPHTLSPINGVQVTMDDYGNAIAQLGDRFTTAGFALSYRVKPATDGTERALTSFGKLNAADPGGSGDLLPLATGKAPVLNQLDGTSVRLMPSGIYQPQLAAVSRHFYPDPDRNRLTVVTRITAIGNLKVWASELLLHNSGLGARGDQNEDPCRKGGDCDPGSQGLLKLVEHSWQGRAVKRAPLLSVLPQLWAYGLTGSFPKGELVCTAVYSVQK